MYTFWCCCWIHREVQSLSLMHAFQVIYFILLKHRSPPSTKAVLASDALVQLMRVTVSSRQEQRIYFGHNSSLRAW